MGYKGYLAVLISGVSFGCMPALAKIIYNNGGNAINLVFWRFLFSTIVFYIIINSNKELTFKISKEELRKIIILCCFGYVSTAILLFLSYNHISSGVATTIHFTYPVFVILASIIIFKEKSNSIVVFSLILCICGIFMFYNGKASISIIGVMLAFLSSVTYSFYILYLDKSRLKYIHPVTLTFYLCLFASFILFVFCILTANLTLNISFLGWFLTFVLSILASLGGVTLLSIGIKIIGPQKAAIFSTFEPITSIITGKIIFHDKLSIRIIIGFLLIIISVMTIGIFDRQVRD